MHRVLTDQRPWTRGSALQSQRVRYQLPYYRAPRTIPA